MKKPKFNYFTISAGKYSGFSVYGWSEYKSGVLKGQTCKSFIENFDTEEEARAAYPDAKFSNKWMEPVNNFNHL